MLRESSIASGTAVDLAAVTDRSIDPRLPAGTPLLELVDAVITGTTSEIEAARRVVHDAVGWDALVDAAAVIATFEMMNRVADATGIRVGRGMLASTAAVRRLAGIADARHS